MEIWSVGAVQCESCNMRAIALQFQFNGGDQNNLFNLIVAKQSTKLDYVHWACYQR